MGIAGRIGGLQRLGCVEHHEIALAQGRIGFLAFRRLAVKGVVNRFAKGVPQLLFLAALHRHHVGLGLPALLQGLDRINTQLGLGAQHLRLFNHGLACQKAALLQSFQRRGGAVDGGLPERLQLGKRLFTDVPTLAPAVAKLMQDAVETFPVIVQCRCVGSGPGIDFFNQGQALGPVFGRLGLDLLEPDFHHFVGFVAGVVKAFPQTVIGHPALVGLFPLVAQGAQAFLHLASAHGLTFGALEQAFGFGHQFFTQLVGAPALPAFQFAGGGERRVGLVFQLVVDDLAEFLERVAQGGGGTGTGFAVAFSHFLLNF